jgi:hypothetical protein
MRWHIDHDHQQHAGHMHVSDVYLSMEWQRMGELCRMPKWVLLRIAACQSRGIHWRIRKRWLSEHTTDNNHHNDAIDDHDNDWDWHNNQHDDKHDHNNDNAMR